MEEKVKGTRMKTEKNPNSQMNLNNTRLITLYSLFSATIPTFIRGYLPQETPL